MKFNNLYFLMSSHFLSENMLMLFLSSVHIPPALSMRNSYPNFLVYPEQISSLPDFRNWARDFVESALTKADYLYDNCRICSFQNEEYIILGVCGLAQFLCDDSNYHFVNKTRPNHGFFGYVFKKESFESFFIPRLNDNDVPKLFKDLYQYVIKYWDDNEPDPEKSSHCEGYREVHIDFGGTPRAVDG